MNLIEKAKKFAHEAHDSINQKRKYSGLPYWVHTDEVAEIVAEVTDDEKIIAAAHLHDVLEDTDYESITISEQFGNKVSYFVFELTSVYNKENYPNLNRTERKILERERLKNISNDAKIIKMADIIANVSDVVNQDARFAKIYLQEKKEILENFDFVGRDSREGALYQRAKDLVFDQLKILNKI